MDRKDILVIDIKQNGPATARDIALRTGLGDPRGVAQTLRRIPQHVVRNEDGVYKLTSAGSSRARRLLPSA